MDSLTNRVDDFAEPRLWESRPGVKTFSLASILGPQIGHPHIPFCSSSEKRGVYLAIHYVMILVENVAKVT